MTSIVKLTQLLRRAANERERSSRASKKYIDETRKMIGNDPEVLNMANGHKLLASDLLLLAALASQAQQTEQEPSNKSPHRESRNNFVLYKENGKTKLMEIIGESDDTKANQ